MNSTKRTARQTEDARFWLLVGPRAYNPMARQIVTAKNMDLVDSARFMALFSMATVDALIAVFDAKYKYEFWRSITAIRNGDIDGNPATERDASVAGREMGQKIGAYVVKSVMQPTQTAMSH